MVNYKKGEHISVTDYLCKRCGVSKKESEEFVSPCYNFEKTYTRHLFKRELFIKSCSK